MKSGTEKNHTLPKKKVRRNARNDPTEVYNDGHSQAQVPLIQHKPQHAEVDFLQETTQLSVAASLPKYRLPLSDIRRTYSSLFYSAMNSTDPVVVEDFFRKYCSSNLMILLKYVGPTTASYFGDHVEIVGLETNIQVFPTILASFPDLIMKVVDNKIRVIKNGYCSSISKYLFWGTKLFELPVDNDYQSLIYSGGASSSSVPSDNCVPLSISASFPSSHSSSVVLAAPLNDNNPDSNHNGNSGIPNNSSVCESINIVCAKVPKSSVSSSEFSLKKHLKNQCLSKRYDDLAKPSSDLPTISLENTITTNSFVLGDPVPDPQRIIAVGTINILINPDKLIYKIEFIHSLKQ
jgi:hypothetical protein